MKITLLTDYVLIRDKAQDKDNALKETDSGIVVAPSEEAFEQTFEGEVVARGGDAGVLNEGDTVLYRQPMFDKILVDKEEFWLGRLDGVIGVI